MATYALVVTSNAVAGRDDEYNEWYDSTHLADVLAIPGVISGKRLEALPTSPNAPPARYLAYYELELDEPTTVLAEIGKRVGAGEMSISDALERGTSEMWLYKIR